MKTIYLLLRESGEYDDYQRIPMKTYVSKEKAEKVSKRYIELAKQTKLKAKIRDEEIWKMLEVGDDHKYINNLSDDQINEIYDEIDELRYYLDFKNIDIIEIDLVE